MAEGIDQAWVHTHEGRHLAQRRKVGTLPEMSLRRALHASGLRYRVAVRLAAGCTPDLLFARHKVAVFVDGCFWHNCPNHGRRAFTGPNAALWVAKLRRNQRNDTRANRVASGLGYRVIRVWECELSRQNLPTVVKRTWAALVEQGWAPHDSS